MKEVVALACEYWGLTIVLAIIAGQTLIIVAHKIAVAIRGWPPPGRNDEDDED